LSLRSADGFFDELSDQELGAIPATMIHALSLTGFVAGAVPLLAFAFFSPGLRAEGIWGYALFTLGLLTFAGLVVSALRRRWLWALVAVQVILLGLVLYETFSDASLYVGT
jgi:hypothetical protein